MLIRLKHLIGALIAASLFPAFALALDPQAAITQYARLSWTERDGLPSSLIWAITQDRDGYIWLGTENGLVRFDGVRFVTWTAIEGKSLPNGAVRALLSSRNGDLWIAFESGWIGRLRQGHLAMFKPEDGTPDRVVALLEDASGDVWAGGIGGLARFHGDRWEHFGSAAGLPSDMYRVMHLDTEGTVWVAPSAGGVFRKPAQRDTFERALSRSTAVRSFFDDETGATWAFGQSFLARYSSSGFRAASKELRDAVGPFSATRAVIRDRSGNLWIGTVGRGLLRVSSLNRPDAKGQWLTTQNGLTSNVVRCLFEDREGNIWVGTQSGLNRFSENSLIAMVPLEASQAASVITAATDGSIWVGTNQGLFQIADEHIKRFSTSDGVPAGAIGALHVDRDGVVWIAAGGRVAKYANGRFTTVRGVALSTVWGITTDFEGAVWLSHIPTGVFRWSNDSLSNVAEVTTKVGMSILTDRTGRVWIGFADGSVAVIHGGVSRMYTSADGLSGGGVGTIFEDRSGAIWVGSDNGLSRFDGNRFVSMTTANGLPGMNVRAIVEDDQDNLWFGVTSGIVRLPIQEFDKIASNTAYRVAATLYDSFDGLRGVPVTVRGYPTGVRRRDGTLWFVTSEGLAIVDPRRLQKRRLPAPVRIERVIADGEPFEPSPQLPLPQLTSRLQIDYTGLSFVAPGKIRFKYRLEGFDPGWVEAGTRRQAYYTNLPPGHYRFHVIADNDGVRNDQDAFLDFLIAPAWYQTLWFRLGVLFAVILASLSAWQIHLRQVRRQFSAVFEERTRVAREIHDTLLQSLVGVAMQFDALANEVEEAPRSAMTRAKRLGQQVETQIREARQSIWDLRSPMLQRKDLVSALEDTGQSIVGRGTVRFELSVSGKARDRTPLVEETLLRIGQEAISNAVRHGQPTYVRATLHNGNQAITLTVSDDGRGFDLTRLSENAQRHYGIMSMEERARIVGGHFRLTSHLGGGTQVEIRVPLIEQS